MEDRAPAARKRPVGDNEAAARRGGSPARGNGGNDEDDARFGYEDDDDIDATLLGCLRRMKKTIGAAIALFITGSVLLAVGVPNLRSTDPEEHERSVAMTVLGSLTFLPGVYACWMLLGAWCRWPGYSYRDIPSYDDD